MTAPEADSPTERTAEGNAPELPAVRLPPDTLVDMAVAAGLWAAGLAWLTPMLAAMTALGTVVHPRRTDWLNHLYCRGQIALTGCRWRAEVHPAVDPERSYLFAQHHTNLLDHVVLYPAVPHFLQGVELKEHFDIPVYGWFMRSRGTIPVERGGEGQTEEILDRFREEIAAGHSILGFPEGTRTLDGRVGRFRTGLFHIARQLALPVAPVAVTGWYETMRKGSWLIRPGHTVTVHVLEPLETEGLAPGDVRAFAAEVQRRVAAVIDAHHRERHGR